jgi:hypothetical protein
MSFIVMITSIALLSGCGREAKDEVMGQIITDCQLTAHSAMETLPLTDERKHFAIGEYVEKCMKEGGLQPLNVTQGDNACFETPTSTEDGKGFIKPLQKCWKNKRSSTS